MPVTDQIGTQATAPQGSPPSGPRKVLNWKVFKPGYWNKQYFSGDDCRRIVDNFQKYSAGDAPYLKAKAKLGHDDKQRFAKQLGLVQNDKGQTVDPDTGEQVSAGIPSLGRIVDCRLTDDGGFAIDIEGVPEPIAKEIEEGRLLDGSVELDMTIPDPADPSKTIPGYVLKAVSFLGDEEPGVKGLPAPVVSFNQKNTSGSLRIKFSEVQSMDRDTLIAQLKAKGVDVGADPSLANLPDAALSALLSQLPAEAAAAAATKPVGDVTTLSEPDCDEQMKKKFADLEKENAEMKAKFGSLEAAFSDLKDKAGDVQQAAKFAKTYEANLAELKKARATDVVNKCVAEGRLCHDWKERTINAVMMFSDEKASCFSDGPNKGKTPFAAELERLMSLSKDHRFARVETAAPVQSLSAQEKIRQLEDMGPLGYPAANRLRAKLAASK